MMDEALPRRNDEPRNSNPVLAASLTDRSGNHTSTEHRSSDVVEPVIDETPPRPVEKERENGLLERVSELIRQDKNGVAAGSRKITKRGARRKRNRAEHRAKMALLKNSSNEQQLQLPDRSGNSASTEHRSSDVVEPVIDETLQPSESGKEPENGSLERAAPAVGQAIRRNENRVLTAGQIRKNKKRRKKWLKKKEQKRRAVLESLSEYFNEEQLQRAGLRR